MSPGSPRRTVRRSPVVIDLESISKQIQDLAARIEELHALVSRMPPLLDSEIEIGDHVLTKVTGEMVAVEILEAVKIAGKTQYRLRRIDNGRALNSLRPSSTFFRSPAS